MQTRLVMLVGALGLLASAAAGATSNSAPAAAASAPAASAPSTGGGRGSSSSGSHGFSGGGRGASGVSAFAGRAGFSTGAEARGAVTGEAAIRGDRGVRSALAWAPATASAAHAVRVIDGLHARSGRTVRPLNELKEHRVVQRGTPSTVHPPYCLVGGAPTGQACPYPYQANLYAFQTPPQDYFCGSFVSVHPCVPVRMPESLCSPANPYREFQCPQPHKAGVRN